MAKLVIFQLNPGDFEQGFSVTLEISQDGQPVSSRRQGVLPPAPQLPQLYQQWQSVYRNLDSQTRITPKPNQITHYSQSETPLAHCQKLGQQLNQELRQWYHTQDLSPLREHLQQQLNPSDLIRLIIQTQHPQLRRLPWAVFFQSFLQAYPQAEIALSPPEYQKPHLQPTPPRRTSLRILAILGDSTNINVEADHQQLQQLPNADIQFLAEPSRQQLHDQLWHESGWDIIFFSGHSSSNAQGDQGILRLNSTDSLNLTDIRNALKRAIARGLQLVILNSCDGLGLANQLADLNLPQTLIMREPVPDIIAQTFLKHFLTAFSRQTPLYLAVRQAREQLQIHEPQYPSATSLPVLCQNPAQPPLTWTNTDPWQRISQTDFNQRRHLTSNPLTRRGGMSMQLDDIFVPLGLVERKQLPKQSRDLDENSEENPEVDSVPEEVTQQYGQTEFCEQVLQQGCSQNSQGRRLAITGEPGAGKTTQLQKIADWLFAQSQDTIVIWVSLADLQEQELDEYLLNRWLKDALRVSQVTADQQQNLIDLFEQGQVWLLLDGVDEMAVENPLYVISRQLRSWINEARILLSCRQNVWDAGKTYLYDFDNYRNLEFSPEQVQQVIDKCFQQHPQRGERLKQELRQAGKESLRRAVRNPLRLTLLCQIWQQREGELPETKAQLYRQFADALYEWKDQSFPITAGERRELEAGLGKLALAALSGESSRFRLTHRQVVEVLGESQTRLYQLAMELGWLNCCGVAAENPAELVYGFWHPTFEEYFAALAVEDWQVFFHHVPENPRLGTYRVFEKPWKEVILLWFGRQDVEKTQKEAFMEALYEFDDGCRQFYSHRALFMAATALAEFSGCANVISQKILDRLLQIRFGYIEDETKRRFVFPKSVRHLAASTLDRTNRVAAQNSLYKFIEKNANKKLFRSMDLAEQVASLDPYNSELLNLAKDKLETPAESEEGFGIWQDGLEILTKISYQNKEAIDVIWDCFITEYTSRFQGVIETENHKTIIFEPLAREMKIFEQPYLNKLDEIIEVLAEIAPNYPRATIILSDVIQKNWSNSWGIDAFLKLNKISSPQLKIVNYIFYIFKKSNNQLKQWRAAKALLHSSYRTLEMQRSLVEFLESCLMSNHEIKKKEAAKSLLTLNPSHKDAIIILIKEIQNIRWKELEVTQEELINIIQKKQPLSAPKNESYPNFIDGLNSEDQLSCFLSKYIKRGNETAIGGLIKLIQDPKNRLAQYHAISVLGEVGVNRKDIVEILKKLQNASHSLDIRFIAMKSLLEIDPDSSTSISTLINFLHPPEGSNFSYQKLELYTWDVLIRIAGYMTKTKPYIICNLLDINNDACNLPRVNQVLAIIESSGKNNMYLIQALESRLDKNPSFLSLAKTLAIIDPSNYLAVHHLSRSISTSDRMEVASPIDIPRLRTPFSYKKNYEILWNSAQSMAYPQFWTVLQHPEMIDLNVLGVEISGPSSVTQNLEQQLTDIASQLQATDSTVPLYLDLMTLEGETDKSAIAQEICNKIYAAAFPESNDLIPEVNNASQLKRFVPNLKAQLQKTHMALVLDHCDPYPELLQFCRQISDRFQICWITNASLEPPLQGFPPQQANLAHAIQSWIDRME